MILLSHISLCSSLRLVSLQLYKITDFTFLNSRLPWIFCDSWILDKASQGWQRFGIKSRIHCLRKADAAKIVMTFLKKSWSEYFLWEFWPNSFLMIVFPGLQIQRIIHKWFCTTRISNLLCFSTGWGINSIVKSKPNGTLLHVKSNDFYKIQEKIKNFCLNQIQ